MRSCGSLTHGGLQSGCRAGQPQYASCSSAASLPRGLEKSRMVRNPRTSRFSPTKQPNNPLARSKASCNAPGSSRADVMLDLNWTEQGIRAVKDAPKRAQAARDLAKKVGVEIKQVYLTSGDSDLVLFVDTPSGDNIAKFALALGALGNVRTRTARAWSEAEFVKLVSELP